MRPQGNFMHVSDFRIFRNFHFWAILGIYFYNLGFMVFAVLAKKSLMNAKFSLFVNIC